jgi:hypothetical protein
VYVRARGRQSSQASRTRTHEFFEKIFQQTAHIYYELCASLVWVYVYQKIGSGEYIYLYMRANVSV